MRKINLHRTGRVIVFFAFLVFFVHHAGAQEMPPRPVSVSFIRDMNFGAFSVISSGGGTVIIDPYGSRNSTGDILLVDLGYLYYPAVFEINGNPGTIIHLLSGSTAPLTGSYGGTLTMNYTTSDPSTPFILPWANSGRLQVSVGGILVAGSPPTNPPGTYSGSFYVMFIQE